MKVPLWKYGITNCVTAAPIVPEPSMIPVIVEVAFTIFPLFLLLPYKKLSIFKFQYSPYQFRRNCANNHSSRSSNKNSAKEQ